MIGLTEYNFTLLIGRYFLYVDGNSSKPHIKYFDENEIFAEIYF